MHRSLLRNPGYAASALACLLGCASTRSVTSPDAKNHGGELELAEARGARPEPGPSELLVRYLRAGGVYFEWQGRALMTLPFATNYPLFGDLERAVGGHTGPRPDLVMHEAIYEQRLVPDERAIEHVLGGGLKLAQIDVLLAGHSHYDHLGDVRPIAQKYAKNARIYLNDTGKNMLSGSPGLRERVESFQGESGFLPRDYAANGQLIRFRAIPSEHAPNLEVLGRTFAWPLGEVTRPWTTPFEQHRLLELRAGMTHALLIDFMDPKDPERVAFRVHYQDAASSPPAGYPPPEWLRERAVDLEVLTLPGRETLPPSEKRYPVGILEQTRARHALVIHYEDFFRPVLNQDGQSHGVRLIPTLTGRPERDFLHAVVSTIREPVPGPCRHPERVEGLCADAFTLPLPGEWLLFETALPHGASTLKSARATP
jgi:hypothetical protein